MRNLTAVRAAGLRYRGLLICFAAWLTFSPGASPLVAEESKPAAAVAGDLAIASDPAGAAVYVDGQFVGHAPVRMNRIPAGDHRVRVVKDGYLENGRVVSVLPGRSNNLQVRLTARAASDTSIERAAGGGQATSAGGGSNKKWIWIGAAGGGGAVAAVLIANRNKPPIPGTITITPGGTGMAGVTSYTFASTGASDPDGDSLSFEWDFGDGTPAGSGDTTTHTYASAGTFTVKLNVKDKKESVAAPNGSVIVAQSVAGNWTGGRDPGFGLTITLNLTQNGTAIGGSMLFSGLLSFTVNNVTGSVDRTTYPATINITTPAFTIAGIPGTFTYRFSGSVDVRNMSGTIVASSTALQPPTITAPTTFTR